MWRAGRPGAAPGKGSTLSAMFDLLLRGGTVIDSSQGRHGRFDVGLTDGKVARVAPDLGGEQARDTVDVDGKLVLPGIIDMHCHLFWGVGSGADPDRHLLARGTTTAVDGGSAGASAFEGFRRYVVEPARTRVLAWLHLSTKGLTDSGWVDVASLLHADPERAAEMAAKHRDCIVGIKLRTSDYAVGGRCLPFVKLAVQVGEAAALPVMLHIGSSVEPLPEVLELLRPGDVITHMFTPWRHGLLSHDGTVLPEVRAARERGILFDCAIGRNHLGWNVARALLEQGFPPDTISTDMSGARAEADAHFHLPIVMSYLLELGIPLEQAVAAVTTRPAQVIRHPELGTLKEGAEADVTVLEEQQGEYTWMDARGAAYQARRRLVPALTLRAGRRA